METKQKIDRAIHGEGNKVSPNMHRVVVYLYNPPRKDSTTGRGSKDFKTTHTYKDIKTMEEALALINIFCENRSDGYKSCSAVKKAYYNGKLLVSDGKWITK